jgi:hypothetical protein
VIQLRKSGLVLDLHPFVSVVRGLEGSLRDELINAGLAGLVEAHGVVLDLTPDALALLDLHESLDVVVRREDLPGRPVPPSVEALAEAQRVAESLVAARQRGSGKSTMPSSPSRRRGGLGTRSPAAPIRPSRPSSCSGSRNGEPNATPPWSPRPRLSPRATSPKPRTAA